MDLGTDYCNAGVLLALLQGHSHKVLDGCWEDTVASISCLLAGCLLNEGARESC